MIATADVRDGAQVVRLAADLLIATSKETASGKEASTLRRAVGDLKAFAEKYIVDNVIAAKLSEAFDQARIVGATLSELNRVRETILQHAVVSLVATMIKNGCVCFSLQQMSLVIADTTFSSRQDVDMVRAEINRAFDPAEENAADEMALDVYRALIELHAAVVFHLYDTARPLPQMLDYRFATPRPTLVLSHRLYDTAARADQLREENKVVHPAFAPREGKALAF